MHHLSEETLSDNSYSYSYRTFDRHEERNRILGTTFHHDESRHGLSNKAVEPADASRSRRVVIMTASMFMFMTGFGMSGALGVIYVKLIDAFKCPRSQAALVQSIYTGFALGGGLITSRFVLKYNIGMCIIIASLFAFLGCALCSFATNITMVTVFVGIISGFFTSVFIISGSIVVNWTFTDNRQMALSLLSCGSSVGFTIVPYITEVILDYYDWSGCLIVLGSLLFMNCIPCGLTLYYSNIYFHKSTDSERTETRRSDSDSSTSNNIAFVLYLIMIFIFQALAPVAVWFAVDIAVLSGFGIQKGTVLLSLFGILGIIGRISSVICLQISANISPTIVFFISFLIWALSHYLVVASTQFWIIAIAMGLQGLVSSVVYAFSGALQIVIRGVDRFPQTVAISNFLSGFAQIIGGYLGGLSFDITGSYTLIFYIAAIAFVYCSISMILIHCLLKRKVKGFDGYPMRYETIHD